MDRGPWQATVYGMAKSRTQLSDFHSLRIFQFVVIHTVKGFSIVNEAEVDVFWNSLGFSMSQLILANFDL